MPRKKLKRPQYSPYVYLEGYYLLNHIRPKNSLPPISFTNLILQTHNHLKIKVKTKKKPKTIEVSGSSEVTIPQILIYN